MELVNLPADVRGLVLEWSARLAATVVVLVVGITLAKAVREVTARATEGRIDAPVALSRIVYYGLLAVTLAIAARQAGLETLLFNRLLLVLFGAATLSVGLAFALGARRAFESLIAKYHYERLIRPGDRIRIGEHQGVVVRYSPVALVLSVRGKELIIPCHRLHEATIELERIDAPVLVALDAAEADSVVSDGESG